jgi:adenosine/AMP kinase
MKDAFPINIMNAIRNIPEVVGVFCATANPVEVVVAETELGRGVLGVIDGMASLGVESEDDRKARKDFLKKIGYRI